MNIYTYVIGDVHGHYDALIKLVNKLPSNAKLVFVGDLIDRGSQSKEVIKFVRENDHLCVLGNHEKMMIDAHYSISRPYIMPRTWASNGGWQTIKSYGLLKISKDNVCEVVPCFLSDELKQFEEDVKWLKSLPLYIELEMDHPSGKPVVISHASIADIWNKKDKVNLEKYALWNRNFTFPYTPIFNIFGHTPKTNVDVRENDYVNVDTGYYLDNEKYGKLSGYCIETGEVFSIKRKG